MITPVGTIDVYASEQHRALRIWKDKLDFEVVPGYEAVLWLRQLLICFTGAHTKLAPTRLTVETPDEFLPNGKSSDLAFSTPDLEKIKDCMLVASALRNRGEKGSGMALWDKS